MKQHKQNFIRKIQIKNYKSIKDLTIEFHAGLNIIIGPNGTGKTNFVNAVNSVFTEKLHADLPIGFEFSFEFVNVDDEIIVWNGGVQEKILKITKLVVKESLRKNINPRSVAINLAKQRLI